MRVGILDLDITVYHCAISCSEEKEFSEVARTVDMFIKNWLHIAKCDRYIGFITNSKENFRETRATTWPYKGHRKAKEYPKWYHDIREYLQDYWKAQMMVGVEADDALAMAQTFYNSIGIESVIITEDKDLLQVPGLHYNKNKSKEVFRISEDQGDKNLWLQVITGDGTDNIPGVSQAASDTKTGTFNRKVKESDLTPEQKKQLYIRMPRMDLYGPKTAKDYLEAYPLEEWAMRTLELYIDRYEDGDHEEGLGDLRFHETFDLIYMLRERPEGLEITFKHYDIPIDKTLEDMFDFY